MITDVSVFQLATPRVQRQHMSNQSQEQKETPKNAEDYHKQEMKEEHEGSQQELKSLEAKMPHLGIARP